MSATKRQKITAEEAQRRETSAVRGVLAGDECREPTSRYAIPNWPPYSNWDEKDYGCAAADCRQCKKISSGVAPVLWENEHFLCVHKQPPCGVVGHMQLLSKRHFQGPSSMTEEEAAAIGPALRRCSQALERVTQCDRLYTAALGSEKSGCHFHAHMVPLYKATPPNNVTGTPFDLFLMEKQAADGVAGAAADADKCADVAALFAKEMAGQEMRRAELLEEEQEDR